MRKTVHVGLLRSEVEITSNIGMRYQVPEIISSKCNQDLLYFLS